MRIIIVCLSFVLCNSMFISGSEVKNVQATKAVVNIPNINLKKAVNFALTGNVTTDDVTTEQALTLETLDTHGLLMIDITGIGSFINLKSLNISSAQFVVSGISELDSLVKMENLNLNYL